MTAAPEAQANFYTNLTSYRRCVARVGAAWPGFTSRRSQRLRQGLFGAPVEKVAENILEDLFTEVLDWDLADVDLQVGRADIVLSKLGVKYLVVEMKRPGALVWHRRSVDNALCQAMRYAAEQKVEAVAISDGQMLYAADVAQGGLRDRVFTDLGSAEPPTELWWLSVHGIYRPCPPPSKSLPPALPAGPGATAASGSAGVLLHHKYLLPVSCFAYVGAANLPATWKLPYLLADGAPDLKRLPKAMQAILSNYRGTKVTIPREAAGDVLVRLAGTATELKKMPCQCNFTAEVYSEAHRAIDQLGRLSDVGCCSCSAATA